MLRQSRVMVVDDDAETLALLREVVAKEGYQVETAEDGESALRQLAEWQPDHRTWMEVEFSDTGCGMEAEQMAQIFQPFFTTKKARRGTGLGLAIALETVRAHGGQIKVDSNPGKGSRFTIVLPTDGGSR